MAPLFSAVGYAAPASWPPSAHHSLTRPPRPRRRAPPRPQTPPRRAPASLGAAASAALFSHTPTVQPPGAPVAAERGATPPAPAPAPAPPPASPRAAAESPAPVGERRIARSLFAAAERCVPTASGCADRDTLLAAAKSSVRPTFSTATLSAAALARLRRPTAPAGLLPEPEPEPEQQPRDSALEPEPEPEPAPRPLGLVAPAEEPRQRSSPAARRKPPKLRSAARAVALSNRGPGSSRPWLPAVLAQDPAQPVEDDPDGPPPRSSGRRGAGPADVLLQLRPSAGLQTFEDETAPLVDSPGGEGDGHERQPGVEDADGAEGSEGGVDMRRSTQEELEEQGLQARGLAGAIAFAQNLKQAVAPVTLLSTSIEDAELAGDGSFGVEYKCVTIFRYDDRRKKDGEQEAVALHKWDELTSFYATLRERHSQLPDLPELDELTFASGEAPCP